MGDRSLRGSAAIVGVGTTPQGEIPGRSADMIAVDALGLALQDAGISKDSVDGLITCKAYGGQGIDAEVGALAGLNPRYSATLDYGTCNFSLHLAAMAIQAGLATTIALLYGTNQRSDGNRFQSAAGRGNELSETYGFFNIAGPAAMAFRRHQALYGTTSEQLGMVAVTQRQHAALNPLAVFRDPMTLEDYLASRYIVRPLRRPDICMISDGGAALIVTTPERAPDFPRVPVYVLGGEQQTSLRQYQNDDHLMRPALGQLRDRIYDHAGIERSDIDALYVQDPTSVWVLQMLEGFGFVGPGESGSYVAEGRIALGSELPVNTNGGQLSEAYMWGWLHLCEAVRQLRGDCGPRQVADARFIQYCSTMGFQKVATSILGNVIPT